MHCTYYNFRRDQESSTFGKLARNKWICRETRDFFLVINVHGMVYLDGDAHLDVLYLKPLYYHHHQENYYTRLLKGLIPSGLRIKRGPAINAISDTFE